MNLNEEEMEGRRVMSEKTIDLLIFWGSAVAILILGLIAIKILTKMCLRTLKKTSLDSAVYTFITNAVKVMLYIILIVAILGHLGISTSTFIAILGAMGAAIALALRDSLANVAGGIIVLVTKPFKQGDVIELNGVTGIVETIDLLVTSLKTFDNKAIRVPNGTISTSVLVNNSQNKERRVDCSFCISYNDSISQAKEILYAVIEQNKMILKNPEPIIGVAGQKDSCIAIDVKVWCKTDDVTDVKYFLEENVKIAFDEAGISIPYPHLDVHVKK